MISTTIFNNCSDKPNSSLKLSLVFLPGSQCFDMKKSDPQSSVSAWWFMKSPLFLVMHCAKLPANSSDMLSSDGGSEDDNLFHFLVASFIGVVLEANTFGFSRTSLFNALGPHP